MILLCLLLDHIQTLLENAYQMIRYSSLWATLTVDHRWTRSRKNYQCHPPWSIFGASWVIGALESLFSRLAQANGKCRAGFLDASKLFMLRTYGARVHLWSARADNAERERWTDPPPLYPPSLLIVDWSCTTLQTIPWLMLTSAEIKKLDDGARARERIITNDVRDRRHVCTNENAERAG